jgi:hypothetical protein
LRYFQLGLVVQLVEQHDRDADCDDQADRDGQPLHQALSNLALFGHFIGAGLWAVRGAKRSRADGGHVRKVCEIVMADDRVKQGWRPHPRCGCAS